MKTYRILSLLVVTTLLNGCSENDVKKHAEFHRWDSYKVTGYAWFGCHQGDLFATQFVAMKDGVKIKGTTCSSFWRGATLRLD